MPPSFRLLADTDFGMLGAELLGMSVADVDLAQDVAFVLGKAGARACRRTALVLDGYVRPRSGWTMPTPVSDAGIGPVHPPLSRRYFADRRRRRSPGSVVGPVHGRS